MRGSTIREGVAEVWGSPVEAFGLKVSKFIREVVWWLREGSTMVVGRSLDHEGCSTTEGCLGCSERMEGSGCGDRLGEI